MVEQVGYFQHHGCDAFQHPPPNQYIISSASLLLMPALKISYLSVLSLVLSVSDFVDWKVSHPLKDDSLLCIYDILDMKVIASTHHDCNQSLSVKCDGFQGHS